jgi:hypothetical protein
MRTTHAVLLLCVLLASCANRNITWDKPGGSQQEFDKDKYECERDMRQSGHFGGGLIGQKNADEFMKSCMRAHGYSERVQ